VFPTSSLVLLFPASHMRSPFAGTHCGSVSRYVLLILSGFSHPVVLLPWGHPSFSELGWRSLIPCPLALGFFGHCFFLVVLFFRCHAVPLCDSARSLCPLVVFPPRLRPLGQVGKGFPKEGSRDPQGLDQMEIVLSQAHQALGNSRQTQP